MNSKHVNKNKNHLFGFLILDIEAPYLFLCFLSIAEITFFDFSFHLCVSFFINGALIFENLFVESRSNNTN